MSERNKAVVRRYVEEVQNGHHLEVLDELFARDIVNHDAPGGLPSPQGAEGIKQFFHAMFTAFPDFRVEVHEQIAEGDKVVTRKTVSGTHRGDFMGIPPTQRWMEIPVIDVFRVVDGRCSDHWSVQDQLLMMRQLGLLPQEEPPASG